MELRAGDDGQQQIRPWGAQMSSVRRLTCVVDGLMGGGASRTMTILANYWAGAGRDVRILTSDDTSGAELFPLHASVRHEPLALRGDSATVLHGIYANIRRIRSLRAAIRRGHPHLVIAFLHRWNILTLAATIGLDVPVVVAEHCDPRARPIGWAWETLRQLLYPRAAAVVLLSSTALAAFPARIQRKSRVIPNPVIRLAPADPAGCQGPSRGGRTVIALGRLHPVKAFDRLVAAFAEVAPRHPDWDLFIWGEGPERPRLERLAHEKGVAGRVHLPGVTATPGEKLQAADLFVLSSDTEGFPMALAEAMALGKPVIATSVGAVPEIVRDGVDGILVPPGDVDALAEAMGRLMSDDGLRHRLASRTCEVLERFGLEKVMAMWEELIAEVVARRAPRRKARGAGQNASSRVRDETVLWRR